MTPDLALTFRLAERSDLAATVVLLNQTFRAPIDESTWEWYNYLNPHGESRIYLAIDADGDPAGVFAYSPIPLRIHGQTVAASSGHHLCLKPTYQGGGPFIALSQFALKGEAEQGIALGLGLPNRKSYLPQKVMVRWSDFWWMDCLYKLTPAATAHECEEILRFDDDFDVFYRRVAGRLEFCVEKDARWMNWRFCERPGRPYTAYVIKRSGELAGYVVVKRWREADGYTKAHIVDMHAADDEALSHVIIAAESYAAGCGELNLWSAAGYPYRAILESRGFAAREEARQPMIAKALRSALQSPNDGSASFAYADGDFVY